MNRNSPHLALFLAIALLFAIPLVLAVNNPSAPTSLNEVQSSRFAESNYPALSVSAEAGNISELNLTARSQTKSWQGYFGNITGTIVLEDALGFVFYDWNAAEPKGEIYATRVSSPTWAGVHCFNFSSETEINLTLIEENYTIPDLAVDGFNETFNDTRNPLFYVGPTTILDNTCPTTWVYQSSAHQDTNFPNVLLTDGTGNNLIYTTIIEEKDLSTDVDKAGYNGMNMDFQLLVAEDGHNSTTEATLTTYYFWVELS